MSHRIRAALAVLAVVAAVRVVRSQRRRLEQELTAERAGQRLVDSVVQTDHEEQLARLRAAVAAAPAASSAPSATRSNSQEGGLS